MNQQTDNFAEKASLLANFLAAPIGKLIHRMVVLVFILAFAAMVATSLYISFLDSSAGQTDYYVQEKAYAAATRRAWNVALFSQALFLTLIVVGVLIVVSSVAHLHLWGLKKKYEKVVAKSPTLLLGQSGRVWAKPPHVVIHSMPGTLTLAETLAILSQAIAKIKEGTCVMYIPYGIGDVQVVFSNKNTVLTVSRNKFLRADHPYPSHYDFSTEPVSSYMESVREITQYLDAHADSMLIELFPDLSIGKTQMMTAASAALENNF
jgi:hypothetical protein